MSFPATLVTGDDALLTVDCLDATGAAAPIALTSTVKVAIVKTDRSAVLAGPWTASSSATGADWPGGIVVATAPAASTTALAPGLAEVEVEETASDGMKTTYLAVGRLRIVRGAIP